MDFLNQTHFIERLQFFNGQRLFANDLQGLEAFNREMRWLHNKSLHQPGIGNGFAVAGKKGDREVTIGPGYATDAEGREIVLTQSVVEPVPPVAGEDDGSPALFDLTVSYPNDADLEETERRDGICRQPGGTIRLKEEPVFCWVRLDENGQPKEAKQKQEILTGMRIVLARAEVLNCQLHKDISIAQRLNARPAKQPYICCGMVRPQWRPWEIAPPDPETLASAIVERGRAAFMFPVILPIGLQAEIDTTQCRFLTTPCYSARISGQRVQQFSNQEMTFTFLVDGLLQITNPRPNQFTAQVLLIAQWLRTRMIEEDTPLFTFRGRAIQLKALVETIASESFRKELKSLDLTQEMQKIIDDRFSDWQLIWMGVEG